ncbi:MAG: hypothetical protein WDW38_009850 [Sanguina aurantia]
MLSRQIASLKQLQSLYQVEHGHLLEHLHSSIASARIRPAAASVTPASSIPCHSSLPDFIIQSRVPSAPSVPVAPEQRSQPGAPPQAPPQTATPSPAAPVSTPGAPSTAAPTQTSRPTLLTAEQQQRAAASHASAAAGTQSAPASGTISSSAPATDPNPPTALPSSRVISLPIPPSFSETLHTLVDPSSPTPIFPSCMTQDQLQQQRDRCCASYDAVLALEAVASGVSELDLEARGALACLASRTRRYLMLRTHAAIGRCADGRGSVDVDLSGEPGADLTLSRKQADVTLGSGGVFQLTNVGSRAMAVDGRTGWSQAAEQQRCLERRFWFGQGDVERGRCKQELGVFGNIPPPQ